MIDLDLGYDFSSFWNSLRPDPMMFTDAESLQIQQDIYLTHSRLQFDQWLNTEKYEMELALGGCENFQNFTYSNAQNIQGEESGESKQVEKMLKILFRDIC